MRENSRVNKNSVIIKKVEGIRWQARQKLQRKIYFRNLLIIYVNLFNKIF